MWIWRHKKKFLFATVLIMASFFLFAPKKKLSPLIEHHWHAPLPFHSVGNPQNPLVIYVHGSPGSWTNSMAMALQDQMLQNTYVVAADRMGFGESIKTGFEASLTCQAEFLEPLLDLDQSGNGAILVGHSYGAPVIVKMAMLWPERIGGIVLVGGSVDPDLEDMKWYNHMADKRWIQKIIGKSWTNSNSEILALEAELLILEPQWGQLEMPVVTVHGTRDKLVPIGNTAFVKARVKPDYYHAIEVHGEGHFLPWQYPETLVEGVLHILKRNQSESNGLP